MSLITTVETMHELMQDIMREAIDSGNHEIESWAIQYYKDVLTYTKYFKEKLYVEWFSDLSLYVKQPILRGMWEGLFSIITTQSEVWIQMCSMARWSMYEIKWGQGYLFM